MTASVVGKISAAKAPITKRAAISWPGVLHSAAAALAAANPTRPVIRARAPAEAVAEASRREHERGER